MSVGEYRVGAPASTLLSYTGWVAVLGFVMLFGLVAAGLCTSIWRRSMLDHAWRTAARRLGLTYRPTGLVRSPRLHGQLGPCSVVVDVANAGNSDEIAHVVTRVTVTAPTIPVGFEVGPQSMWGSMARRFWARAGRPLEDRFDQRVKVAGHPTYTLAVLEPDVRERLQQLTSLQGQVQRGQLMLTLRGRVRRADRLISVVEFLTALGRDLSVPEQAWPNALRERATEDPSAQIRRRSLETLVDRYPASTDARRAVRDRLGDFAPEVRLVAARHAGEDGIEVLSELFYDPEVEAGVRSEALRSWSARAPKDDPTLRRALAAALTSQSDTMLRVGALILVAREDRGMRNLVLGALKRGSPAIRSAALTALGAVGDPDDVGFAAEHLDARETDVSVAAVRAVGRLGGLDMVARLRPLTRGLTTPGRVKEAARAAITAIQGRAGGIRGGLALVDDGGGGLSEVASGALSAPDSKPPR